LPTKLFTAKYYDTYYLANVVSRVAFDSFIYARDMEGFHEGRVAFVKPFPKRSAFHHFIEYIVSFTLRDQTLAVNPAELREEEKHLQHIPMDYRPDCRRFPINDAFDTHGLQHESFEEWLSWQGKSFDQADEDDVYEYCDDLLVGAPWEELVTQISDEVFFVLFSNRAVLQAFNETMAAQLSKVSAIDLDGDDDRRWLKRDGVLNRVAVPSWASTAVFHRDRGLCAFCFCDVTGLINISGDPHCDHMVPLALGGLNDVTNLQLLCKECNSKKRHSRVEPSEVYERWY
jgi:HNH endonuclease